MFKRLCTVAAVAALMGCAVGAGFPASHAHASGALRPPVRPSAALQHAVIHNLYLDNDWDAHSPPSLGRTIQDDFTRKLLAHGYSSKSAHYGGVDAYITGAGQATGTCPAPGPVFDSTAQWSRILCETHRPPSYSANGTGINHWQVYVPATRV